MASVLHGSARTTPRIRAELQASKESARSLAARYDLNPKTVRKRRRRTTTADAPMGPKARKSTVLTPAEEAIVVAFRQKTLLPLDDVLGCMRDTIPNSAGAPCTVASSGMGSPGCRRKRPADKRNRFKSYQIGYVHIDSCELRHTDGKLVMFLAIDRVSKFTYVEFHDSAGKKEGAAFLRNVVAAFPYKIHTVLTDNGYLIAADRIAPVVILTAFSQRELVERARDAGAMAYLVKPFTKADLVPAIEMAVSRYTEIKALDQEVNTLKDRLKVRKLLYPVKGPLQSEHGLTEPQAFLAGSRRRRWTAA